MSEQHHAIADIHEAKWPEHLRQLYHESHPERFAGEGLSFPIQDGEDVEHAAHLYTHGSKGQAPEVTKHKIIHIAKSLGLEHHLPQAWREEVERFDPDGDGDDDSTPEGDLDHDYWNPDGTPTALGAASGESVKESSLIILQGRVLEAAAQPAAAQLDGSEIRVTIIRGGRSANGYYYAPEALQQIARMIEGARAYADHGRTPADDEVRSIKDLVGFYKDARYVPDGEGRVDATLHILEAAQWLRSMVKEAMSLGKPDLIGLSVDIFGKWNQAQRNGSATRDVTRILSLNSCDIVTRPSAGGSLQRILHHTSNKGDSSRTMDQKDKKGAAAQVADPPVTPTEQQAGAGAGAGQHITETVDVTAEIARLREAQAGELAALRAEQEAARLLRQEQEHLIEAAKLDRAQALLDRKLAATGLPQAVQTQIAGQFSGRIFEEAALDTSINAMRAMLAGLTSQGLIRDNGWERTMTGAGQITEAEKLQAAIDCMFDLEPDQSKFAGIKGFTSIREAYYRITGDSQVSGAQLRDLERIRVSEHAPIGRITEADTTTASFSYLLGTSMNKRLLKDYQAWPAEWQQFCVIAPIKDFKQQSRVRLGAFGSLATVPEDTAYQSITLTDTAAVYVPTKRGNLVTVSRETIINDDLFAIKQIPTKLAVAAAYTLAEFVYSFLSTNPNIFDGNALFLTGAPHTNLGTTALSSAAMQSGVTAMREQTNFAGKRLGLKPSYLIVPPELEFTAMVVTKSAGVPGSANNDINPMLGYVKPIISPQLTNTSQWFFAADPRVVDTIEIGFVGGQVNPALFIQDQPLFGLNFTQDVISYKIRHEYGGAVLDWRGLYRGI